MIRKRQATKIRKGGGGGGNPQVHKEAKSASLVQVSCFFRGFYRYCIRDSQNCSNCFQEKRCLQCMISSALAFGFTSFVVLYLGYSSFHFYLIINNNIIILYFEGRYTLKKWLSSLAICLFALDGKALQVQATSLFILIYYFILSILELSTLRTHIF